MTKLKDRKIVQLIRKTVEGKNKAGEVLHGALDILPLPNQFLGKALKAVVAGEWNETKNELLEAFTLRNMVAIGLTTALIMGWLSPEDIEKFMQVLNELL
tara:strand:+ start:109 stop:408 length:300 start_codon:yes stop_codon:yes gene_type:complete